MTEAYTSLENTMKYYNYGSHVPFNFNFITNVNTNSSAMEFKNIIEEWMKAKPKDGVANWVVRKRYFNVTQFFMTVKCAVIDIKFANLATVQSEN